MYDSQGKWQATPWDFSHSSLLSHIDTTSSSTQHYVFLSGADGSGAIGIAYLGTPCLHLSWGKLIQIVKPQTFFGIKF